MFLQLLVAQLRYQDPMNPADSGEFLAQSAQFTALEKMQDVADQTGALLGAQMAFGASGLVGRHVTYTHADGDDPDRHGRRRRRSAPTARCSTSTAPRCRSPGPVTVGHGEPAHTTDTTRHPPRHRAPQPTRTPPTVPKGTSHASLALRRHQRPAASTRRCST